MDDNAKLASSYQLDQEILDARGINMTVEEVAGLPTCRYAERVQKLKLNEGDLAFLKGLRRRIKNRLASQNSRRRSMEHLRRLTRELRAARVARDGAAAERRELVITRDRVRAKCATLRMHVVKVLAERSDPSEIPSIDVQITRLPTESQPLPLPAKKEIPPKKEIPAKKVTAETKIPLVADCFKVKDNVERDKSVFECRIDKLVQQSVNHIFKDNMDERNEKKVFAKTVFISNDKFQVHNSNVKSMVMTETDLGGAVKGADGVENGGVLNLSVKPEKRRSHGRKQVAPRRITYVSMEDDGVLDLKIKKEPQ